MGTRADFYIGIGPTAEWLGSIAWDGYPDGLTIDAPDEAGFRANVAELAKRADWTSPEQGWPWPWEDSNTTDYAYAWDGAKVVAAHFGYGWWPVADWASKPPESVKSCDFPDMSARKRVTLGRRSGVIVLGG